MPHAAAAAHVAAAVAGFGMEPDDQALHFGSLSFDISIEEIFTALAAGARLVLWGTEPFEVPRFRQILATRRLTRLDLPTAAWAEWVRQSPAVPGGMAEGGVLRSVAVGGEAMPAAVAERFAAHTLAARSDAALLNTYGPTEAVITSTLHRVAAAPGRVWGQVPIGRPLGADRTVVTDAALRPVPAGVAGELAIGGPGLSRGYLGKPALTAERFVPDPFSGRRGARLYRSGDLVRWLADGTLAFLGRNDRQVKIRGFRIEIGEVEAALGRAPGVGGVAVVARTLGDGERELVAYLAPASGELDLERVRRHAAEVVPGYMVPAAWVVLDALPMTTTGKVDRRALPAPAAGAGVAERTYVAPRTPAEELVAGVFAQVLEVERAGAFDSFFELGGHSLKATRLASRLRAVLGREVPLRWVFERPTVAGLAAALAEAGEGASSIGPGGDAPIEARPRPAGGAELPLSFSQERLWFLDRLRPGTSEYNIPLALRLSGALRHDALATAWSALLARHEPLRTVFVEGASGPLQRVRPAGAQPLPLIDLSGLPGGRREEVGRELAAAEAGAPFDLAEGPLLRTTVVRLGPSEHLLVAVVHHIVSDGWSMEVLVREMTELYGAAVEGRPPELAPLAVQYGDYAAWEREHLAGARLAELLGCWSGRLDGVRPLDLPTDRPRPAERIGRGATVRRRLPAALRSGLEALARHRGATSFMVLVAAFQALLSRLAGDDDVAVGTPIANRRRAELEPLIGFFVNTLVLRGDLSGDPTFAELLERTRAVTLEAYAHQELPFERLVEELAPERDPSRTPLFQVMMTLQKAIELKPAGATAAGLESRRSGSRPGWPSST